MSLVKARGLFLLFLTFFMISNSYAMKAYTNFSYNFGAVVSESEFYNGGTDSTPGLAFGLKFEAVSLEMFLRKYKFEEDYEHSTGNFHTIVDDTVIGFGFRYNFLPTLNYIIGLQSQTISSDFTTDGNGSIQKIESSTVNFLVGGGINAPIFDSFELYTDIIYLHSTGKIAVFTWDVGLRWFFADF